MPVLIINCVHATSCPINLAPDGDAEAIVDDLPSAEVDAGHIPGALNRPFTENIGADGKFKPADVLKAEFTKLLAGRDPSTVVHHCGSGVSALPNLLAMEIAGLGSSALYAGSWSEWCSDTSRPVAKG